MHLILGILNKVDYIFPFSIFFAQIKKQQNFVKATLGMNLQYFVKNLNDHMYSDFYDQLIKVVLQIFSIYKLTKEKK